MEKALKRTTSQSRDWAGWLGLSGWLFAFCLTLTSLAAADAPDFERQVAPTLVARCLGCHNASEASGGLDLTRQSGLAAGGDSGASIHADRPAESLLLARIASGEMPPPGKAPALSAAQQLALEQWVLSGAQWPTDRALSVYEFTTDRRAGLDWWSLKPVTRPTPPDAGHGWARNPIDSFIAQTLQSRGLTSSPEASRATLIRRVTFDLLGLPPTPDEIARFVADTEPDAFERLVDGLLASPRYGERWGRHWLDVVRFGESDGYETNKPRANAWPFRDYVIRAFNQDTPYPQFILEQLAGDQVGADMATGFIVGGTHDAVGNQTVEGQLQQRVDDLNDMVGTAATAFLGLTVQCARCHDHKFDPIAQRDYYALQAVFAGVAHGEREAPAPDYAERLAKQAQVRQEIARLDRELAGLEPLAQTAADVKTPQRSAVSHLGNLDRFEPTPARYVRFTVLATNQSEPCLDEIEVFTAEEIPRNVALASGGAKATSSSVFANGGLSIHQTAHLNDGLYGNSHSWISSEVGAGWAVVELPDTYLIDRVAWARDREGTYADRLPLRYKIEVATGPDQWRLVAHGDDRISYAGGAESPAPVVNGLSAEQANQRAVLVARRQDLLNQLPVAMNKVYAGTFSQPGPTLVLYRGDPQQPRDPVTAGGVTAIEPEFMLPADAPEAQRRLALARWLGDAANPLTARVMVNRLWQHHFGQGLVGTPSNFGFLGGQPSHPELLDWLAAEFVSQGWSVKAMHRLIVLSAAYRQSSDANAAASAVDAGNRLLWRYSPRRLEAEPLRDAVLAVTGKLDGQMGGPGYDAFEPNTNYVHVYVPKKIFGEPEWRRMVYQQKARMQQDSTFGEFDCPDASQATPRRNVSTTALQALNLLNSPFMVQQAGFFAERLERESPGDASAQLDRAFWLAFGRPPDAEEAEAAGQLVATHGLAAFCRALLNANEFLYID